MNNVYVLVMAGGRGTRFWPVSRRALPKQCISLDGGPTLVQRSVQRVLPLVPVERVLVVTAADMAAELRRQLPELPEGNLLVEPEGRNTAAAVAWGALAARERDPDAVLLVLPSDHLFRDEDGLRATLASCAAAAAATQALVTVGIRPDRPETGFGWLAPGDEAGDFGGRSFVKLRRFVEKPDLERARAFLQQGYLWNAGIFAFSVRALEAAFRAHLPAVWEPLDAAGVGGAPAVYPSLPSISLDFGVMEKASHVLTTAADLGWSDVGAWSAVAEHLPVLEGGRGLADACIALESRENLVHAPGKLVALIGIEGLVVVDTPDALLVCKLDSVQDLRKVVQEVEARGLLRYL